VLGERAAHIAAGAVEAGYPAERVYRAASHGEAAAAVRQVVRPGDWLLLKGSRGMRMEEILVLLSEGKK